VNAPVAARTLEEAITWQLRFGAGDATSEDRSAFEGWLAAKPDNARAWRQLGELDAQLAPATAPAGRTAVLGATRPVPRGSKAASALVVALAIGLAAAIAERHAPLSGLLADHATRTGERRSVILPDGSRVVLNTRSAIDVEFDERRRAVVLRDGEILVETVHGELAQGRPFVVLTRDGSMRALGTRFLVRRLEQGTLLTVLQSAVAMRAAGSGDERVIREQESATLRTGGIDGPHPAAAEGDAWIDGMLVVDNARLADVVAELARYRLGRLVADPRVAELRVTGTFPLADPELALAALTRALPLTIEQTTNWWITLAPAGRP
jgi:transmembrane sensor